MKTKSPILLFLGILLAGLILISSPIHAQDKKVVNVDAFNKIILSPYIDLVLKEGDEEKVEFESRFVDDRLLRADVDGTTLRIYLTGARLTPTYHERDEWGNKKEAYRDAQVTAIVTYKDLKKLSIRGDEKVRCESPITGDKFKVKVFGDNKVYFSSIEATKFVAALYGDNKLSIDDGKSEVQKYKSFGDNQIDAREYESPYVKTSNFGDSEFSVNATDLLMVTSFGDSEVRNIGRGDLARGIILGDHTFR